MTKNTMRIGTKAVALCILCVKTAWGWLSGSTPITVPGYSISPANTEIHNQGLSFELVDGVPWLYDVSEGNAIVVGGPGYGDVIIPATIGPYPVTAIMEGVFYNRSGLTSVTIPRNVKTIGDSAFYGCTNLMAVNIHDLSAWCGITFKGEYANPLPYAKHLYLNGEEGTMIIPDDVTSISQNVFNFCQGLTNVVIGANVTNLLGGTFSNCSALEAINVAAGNEKYASEGGVLFDKGKKTLIFCPNGKSGIYDIPDGVTSIMDRAFFGCSVLVGVTIPKSVTNIGNSAFFNCNSLKAFSVANDNPTFQSISGLLLTKDGKTLVCGVNGDVVIPDGVVYIGDHAFYGRSGLTNVTIPDSVTSIESWAFYGCSGLVSVSIPRSITNIAYDAFSYCNSLESFSVSSDNPTYQSLSGLLLTKDGKILVHGVNGAVEIPDSVTRIGSSAFYGCSGLTRVRIPDSVTIIEADAFAGCSALTSVAIPDSVTGIGVWAFTGCSSLETLYVPASWEGTTKLEYANLPEGCTVIYGTPQEATSTGVPYGWLEENAGEALTAAGGDYEVAARAKAVNGREMWECYMAGLKPDELKDFTAEITFSKGVPQVSWEPDLNNGKTQPERSYVVEGKPTMSDEWDATNAASRFFRVKVGMPGGVSGASGE